MDKNQLLKNVFDLISKFTFTFAGGGLILVAAGWFASSFDISALVK